MDSKRPPNCICPAAQCYCKKKPRSTLDSDVFYDTVDDPTDLTEVSSSLVLKEVADTAENLITAFEWKMKQTIEKFRQAIASMKAGKTASQSQSTPVTSFQPGTEFSRGNDYESGVPSMSVRVDQRLKINIKPVVVDVPLTLYVQASQTEVQEPEEVNSKTRRAPSYGESVTFDFNEIEAPFRDRQRKKSLGGSDDYDGSRVVRYSRVYPHTGGHMLWETALRSGDEELDLRMKSDSDSSVLLGDRELPHPQQKDLDLCVHCNCEQCPVYDLNRQIVCPKNCNCCICPWHIAPSDQPLSYHRMRTCNCNKKHTPLIPGEPVPPATSRPCQCLPDLDICPCRDIAESKHIELYGTEMFQTKKIKKP